MRDRTTMTSVHGTAPIRVLDAARSLARGRLACLVAGLAVAWLLLPTGLVGQTSGGAAHGRLPQMFQTADQCMACHNQLVTPSGEDVSIGSDWQASMMANSSRDPYWQAAVRREILDHPEAAAAIQNECSTCHMPMTHYRDRVQGLQTDVFAHLPFVRGGGVGAGGQAAGRASLLAADGVSCTICHQIREDRLGTAESFVGQFVVDTTRAWGNRQIFGPFQVDTGRVTLMRSAANYEPVQADHVQSSELCASCHTLYTHALDEDGEAIGRLPEQVPYLEWRHSDYPGQRSCQSCHMPVVRDSVAVTGVMGQPRAQVSRHVFRGGNFFMLRVLNRYRDELGVQASPQQLSAAVQRTLEHLQSRSATVSVTEPRVADGRLEATVTVENLAGHKLPTAYPSRRAWLHVTFTDRYGDVVFESGAVGDDGSIRGNDNDEDPDVYEPHRTEITGPDQVQIYESIMVDADDRVTTGLTTGLRFVKDNRLLPAGFDKSTAPEDVAVRGKAAADEDFTGGRDRTRYAVDVSGSEGPYRVHAELWYQPIAFRWAQNLKGYDASEIRRFVSYYESMSDVSATVLARGAATGGGSADADRPTSGRDASRSREDGGS